MIAARSPAFLLCAALGFAGTALAQDTVEGAADAMEESVDGAMDDAGKEADDLAGKVEDVVEQRAAEEKRDGEPSDANLGEASYNIADCEPADADAEGEPAGGTMADDDTGETKKDEDGADPDADGEAGEQDMDECEEVMK